MKVTVTLEQMLEQLPRYGVGRSGQVFVRFDDVIQAINTFYSMKEETDKHRGQV
jgi:hypothetical protein